MLRAFALGVAVGIVGVLAWTIEAIRRNAERSNERYRLWPRTDGSDQGYGGVWDHGA
jgi:hypothetical protein